MFHGFLDPRSSTTASRRRGRSLSLRAAPWKVVVKRRVRKAYRHEQLDSSLRKERTIKESSAIRDAKIAGARLPSILGLDIERSTIIMTFIDGLLARDIIDTMSDARRLSL